MPNKKYKGQSVRDIVIEIATKQEIQEQALVELKGEDKVIHKRISSIKIVTTISSLVGGFAGGVTGFYAMVKGKIL